MNKAEKNIGLLLIGLLLINRRTKAGPTPAMDDSLMNYSFKGKNLPSGLARGMRVNNPGNLKEFGEQWQGRVTPSSDPVFVEFKSYVYGLRAMIKLLKNYIRQGNNTIESILHRYAPTSENDTKAYVDYVVQKTGIPKNRRLTGEKEQMREIVKHMANLEQGIDAQTDRFFDLAYSLI